MVELSNSEQGKKQTPKAIRPFGWQPGQSGNPGGRPKLPEEIRQMLTQVGPEAILKLVEWMRDPKADPKIRIRACETIIERAFGKVPQAIEGLDQGPLIVQILKLSSQSAPEDPQLKVEWKGEDDGIDG